MQKKSINRLAKVITALVLSAGIFVGSMPLQAQALSIKDIAKASSYAKEPVQWMVNNNVVGGDQYGYFNPSKKISRAELVTIIVKAFNIDTTNLPQTATFSDVPVNHWAFKYVEAATRAGIISGTGNGKFGINGMSTREQVTTILLNSLSLSKESVLAAQGLDGLAKFTDEENMSDWAKASIQFAISNNIMSGTGANTFSPSGKATKEQIAVILYNFLRNSESIILAAEQLRKPVINFNGDIIKLSEAVRIENGEVLVPAKAFVKMGANITVDETKSIVVIKNSVGDKSIYFETGKNLAFVNYSGIGNPFAETQTTAASITLSAVPELSGEDVLVPAKATATTLGMSFELNVKTNLVTIKDSTAVNTPIVYNALKAMLDYKGEYKTSLEMTLTDTVNWVEMMGISYTMQGAKNGSNSTAKTTFTALDPLYGEETIENDVIKLGQQLFSKDIKTGIWSQITEAAALEQGIMYFDSEADKAETQKLLDAYSKMNIISAGKTIINGEEVTRYQVKAGKELINDLVPSDMLEGISMSDIYNKGFSMIVDMYINNNGQLVKQLMRLNAGIEQVDFGMDLKLTMTTEFSNIGKTIEIVSPI